MIIFEKKTKLKFTKKEVFNFHENPGALKRLSPPWQKISVKLHKGGIKKGAKVKMHLYDPVKITWKAKHTEYIKNKYFEDIQTFGPFSKWKHKHIFKEDENGFCEMTDRVEFKLFFHFITFPLFKKIILKKLNTIFQLRHKILKRDLEINSKFKGKKIFLISGSGGVLGNLLIPRLTTAGHEVKKLVRRLPKNGNEFYWNPDKNLIDKKAFTNTDVVINLSGEPIAQGYWTKKKKKKIVSSRKNTATLLAKTINSLENPPSIFISSSATGFYGNKGNELLNETSGIGDLFISKVCKIWEDSALLCTNKKTRTIILRTGVVLTPEGGALPIILKGFYSGLAAIPGSGNQYLSWISHEDWINGVYHIVFNEKIKGYVNLCSNNPVTFNQLMTDISTSIKLPFYFRIPSFIIKVFMGQKGYETVLCGAKVFPDKLLANNFKFFHNTPKEAIDEMLGKESLK
ncbi:MAG: TIGR01777 family oxidoreductase [Desulforegulaceae bacterium]|nr:TIGR01777 family oxidoreductase [Desulforegulaceae bacterium]